MQFPVVLLLSILAIILAHPNIYHQCQPQFFNPLNYLDQLPSLKMPYINNVPIPNIPLQHIIRPTPALTTKVINVVTKYVARNPVCIKSSGKKKPPCKKDTTSATKNANDHIITKEYFVNHRLRTAKRVQAEEEQYKTLKQEIDAYKNIANVGPRPETLRGSEMREHATEHVNYKRIARDVNNDYSGIDFTNDDNGDDDDQDQEVKVIEPTPELHARKIIKPNGVVGNLGNVNEKMKDLLIEDRLDRLEDMLPHYTRMRVYQTSTITVTRTRNARMATATLMVKNCVPDGIDYCKKRQKTTSTSSGSQKKKKKNNKRKSKVAVEQNPTIPNYNPYYYG